MERFCPIPITGVCQSLQRLEPFSCSRLLQTESTPVSTGLERFEFGLPAVEMVSDPRDLLREHVVAGELSAETPVSLSVTVLDEDVIVGRGAVEEGQEPLRERVDGSIWFSRGGV